MTEHHLKTRNDVIEAFGEPTSETTNEQGFFVFSFAEDCFLMGGGRARLAKRLVFAADKDTTSKSKVVYLDSENNVIKIF